jgi:hypothetical protein
MLWISLALAGLVPGLLAAQEITREQGYDRRGNDYTSFHARSLCACVETCRYDYRCRAYSYDTREGTCYLKERVNSAQRKEEMVTGYKREEGGDHESGLTEERGYDRRGSDYTSFRSRSLSDCKGACRRDGRCRAYSYDTREGTCYLKSRVNSAQRKEEMVTGYKSEDDDNSDDSSDDDDRGLTEERGYDRRGNDYTSFRARGLSDCLGACRKDHRCRAYTYDTRNDACYLKDRVNSAQRNGDMVTGYKREDGGGYDDDDDDDFDLTEERGYDRRGNDYTSFRARGLSDCMAACRRDGRCRAYTYDTRNDACYLKDRVNSSQRDNDMVTGYKREGN